MKKKILLSAILSLVYILMFSQNIVLKGYDNKDKEFNSSELSAISAVKVPACKLPTKQLTLELSQSYWTGKYDIEGEPIRKDTAWQEIQSWQYFGQSLVANGLYNIKAYTWQGKIDSGVCVGYVLGFANMNESFSNAFWYFNKKDNITKKTIKTILKDKSYHEGIYQWLKPALVLAWKSLGQDVHDFYKGLITYVKTFNYDAEKKYYESLKSKKQENKFTSYEPNGKYEVRRKAKAWIFRRIYFDDWDFQYALKWLNRMEKEIML